MRIVERHLKSLKTFVRLRSHIEGSMVDAYMVYQYLVYISECIPKVVVNINVHCIWEFNTINKFEREVLLGKGRIKKVKGEIVE
jgi:hypothetical protein